MGWWREGAPIADSGSLRRATQAGTMSRLAAGSRFLRMRKRARVPSRGDRGSDDAQWRKGALRAARAWLGGGGRCVMIGANEREGSRCRATARRYACVRCHSAAAAGIGASKAMCGFLPFRSEQQRADPSKRRTYCGERSRNRKRAKRAARGFSCRWKRAAESGSAKGVCKREQRGRPAGEGAQINDKMMTVSCSVAARGDAAVKRNTRRVAGRAPSNRLHSW